jgi:protein translocase SecG subunit
MVLYIIACFLLILFVLLQPGKADAGGGLAFGGGNTGAFGPRGTQTVLAKITITAAIVFFLVAFIFSIPGIFERRSIGEGVGQSEQAPAPLPAPEQPPAAVPPAPTPAAAANANAPAAKPESITRPTEATKNGNAAKANANKK